MPFPIVKYRVADATRVSNHPIATSTYDHVCPIFHGQVIDLSDTTLQRVQYVVCHPEDYEDVKRQLKPLVQEARQKKRNQRK